MSNDLTSPDMRYPRSTWNTALGKQSNKWLISGLAEQKLLDN